MQKKTTCFQVLESRKFQDHENRREMVLKAVQETATQMLHKYEAEIQSGKVTTQEIIEIGNRYLKILAASLTVLLSSCFLNPFRGSSEPEIAPPVQEPAPPQETEPPEEVLPAENFPFERDTVDTAPKEEVEVPPFQEVKLWPNNENFWFVVGYAKLDKAGRKVRYDIRMQQRQTCGNQDTDWYDMLSKREDMDNVDYILIEGKTLDAPDTVSILARSMRERDPSGMCEWSFRTRIEASRSSWDWSGWGELKFRIKLVDPRSIQEISTPRIDFIN